MEKILLEAKNPQHVYLLVLLTIDADEINFTNFTNSGTRISDITGDIERPIVKYTESQMMDLPRMIDISKLKERNMDDMKVDKHDHREKAEVLIIIEKSVTPEKCEEIVSNQNYDGSIELGNTICNKLNALKEEIITAIQRIFKILKSPKFSRKYYINIINKKKKKERNQEGAKNMAFFRMYNDTNIVSE
ncbi:hypothetical protein F8M41_014290 [Gigaspora margarita]|uniref:Uncharacterized protein n=1 Tax=Gigaspora margarita TaxID=4874 RepID=A0A8H4ARP0_GIGMA|nr:hypothetical protein F8M41_014290 [Gigaspora margarita]